jgi:WD40 repeat protein/DNA-binding SARP family transcriptional activator
MPLLTLDLLGPAHISTDGHILDLRVRKELALLAYLAIEQQRHRREVLLGLLWPDTPEETARNNLRVVLSGLRRALGAVADAVLLADRQYVQFAPASAHTLDVTRFRNLLAAGVAHAHAAIERCEICIARLVEAVELYRGDFLAGFSLPDSAPFDEWATVQREQLHQQQLHALDTLASAAELRGDPARQIEFARRQLTLEPWREQAHAQLMRGLARAGDRSAALAQFDLCRRILAEELGLEPSPELAILAEQLRTAATPARERPSAPASHAPLAHTHDATAPKPDWPEIPEVARMYGRTAELAQLQRWLVDERCRLVGLLGIGGVGKTTLAAAAATAVSEHFDTVVWRSLLNAPPLGELLRDVLAQLTPGAPIELPNDPAEQIGLLLGRLRRVRCLLVLDNLESILQSDEPGRMRLGYDGYAQLLRAIAERSHRSGVLLTSRERPQGLGRLEEDTPLVRLLPVGGLSADAGTQMLAARGLEAGGKAGDTLVMRYSGNPLALRLVAQTVREVFDGDIRAFLEAEAPIFEDIGAVLDQQVARLSGLERELLIWLALEREPVGALALRANLLHPGPPRATLEAVRALLRRSLVAQSGTGLMLQNVVTEYLTETLIEQVVGEIAGDLSPGAAEADEPMAALNRFALRKARAKDYVRASQSRLILEPLVERALHRLGRASLVERLRAIVAAIQARGERTPGYAAGNVLNVLLHLGSDLGGADFSHLCVWQASLERAHLPGVSFAGADLSGSSFSHPLQLIRAAQFDADNHLRIAIFATGQLHVWRVAESQLREERTFGIDTPTAIFSPNRRLLIGWHADGRARVWEVSSGELLHTLDVPTDMPWEMAMALSPDSHTLASAHVGGEVLVWDVISGALRHTLRDHTAAVPALAFSPDGRMLASGDVGGIICLWQLNPLELLQTLHGHSQEVHVLAFDPTNAELLASGSHDHTVRLWDVPSGRTLRTLGAHAEAIRVMAFSPDGRTLASGGNDTFICLWDVATGQLRHSLTDLRQRCRLLAFDPSGQTLAIIGSDESIGLWSVENGQPLQTVPTYTNGINAIDVSPDATQVIGGGTRGISYIWDVAEKRAGVRALVGHTDRVLTVGWSPRGDLLASAGCDRLIRLWDAGTGRMVRTLHGHGNDVENLQFSPDGRRLLSCGRDATVRIWDVETGAPLQMFRGHTKAILIQRCAFRPDGGQAASSMDTVIQLWDIGQNGNDAARALTGHTAAVFCIAYSPDGRLLLSGGFDQQILVWSTDDGCLRYVFPDRATITISIAFHPGGELLATADDDFVVRLWRIAPAALQLELLPSDEMSDAVRLCAELRGHSNALEMVRFSPDGRRLYSASKDETVREWDVVTGACLRILRAEGPYAGLDITSATGLSDGQRASLRALGAVERA